MTEDSCERHSATVLRLVGPLATCETEKLQEVQHVLETVSKSVRLTHRIMT